MIQKPVSNQQNALSYSIMYFIHIILTNMFWQVSWPSSGWCSNYKNTVVVICDTITS